MGQVPPAPTSLTFTVSEEDVGRRLDVVIAEHLKVSRSQLLRAFAAEGVHHNGEPARKGMRLELGDFLEVAMPRPPVLDLEPRHVDFDVLYEDDYLIVIDKPAGLSVHPVPGQRVTTLVHGLLQRWPELSDASGSHRPGIVHRLDRFTSGVLVVAKDNSSHAALAQQFARRRVTKIYDALVEGVVEFDQNVVTAPIIRDPRQRECMMTAKEGKEAVTRLDVVKRFARFTHLECRPAQGRRHQIRVHCLKLKHRILCDTTYRGADKVTEATLRGRPFNAADPVLLNRLALHARRLEVIHPVNGQRQAWEAPLPADLLRVIATLHKF